MAEGLTSSPGGARGDKRAGLVTYGVIAVGLGVLSALAALVTAGAAFAGAAGGEAAVDWRSAVSGVAVHLAFAVVLVWLGIGSIRARRWVRPLMLVVAWTWLCLGIATIALWLLMLPDFQSLMRMSVPEADLPAGALTAVCAVLSVLFLVFGVVIPVLFVFFYQSEAVRAALERHDPAVRWTDRCPSPVLGLSLGFWFLSAWCLLMTVYGALPAFGFVLKGLPAVAALVALAAAFAVLARATYLRTLAGWWGAVVVSILAPIATCLTLARMEVAEIYAAIGFTEEQLHALGQYRALGSMNLIVWTGVLSAVFLAYTVWLKRYFVDPGAADRGAGGTVGRAGGEPE